MKRADLIKELSKKTGFERKQVETILETLITSLEEHITHNETISLNRFGAFMIKRRKAKIARNITRNKAIKLPARNVPAFRPSKYFLERVKKVVKDEVQHAS